MQAEGRSQTGAPLARVPIPSARPPRRALGRAVAPARSGLASRVSAWATWTLLFVVVAMFCFLVVGPRTGAYQVSVVLSNSMQPEWEAGDIVISRPERPDQVRVGQVITYNPPIDGRPSITHRVIEVTEPGAAPVVRTKGDANDSPDEWGAVRLTQGPVQKVTGHVPNLGWALAFLQNRTVGILTTMLAPILLLLMLLRRIWRPEPEPAGGHA